MEFRVPQFFNLLLTVCFTGLVLQPVTAQYTKKVKENYASSSGVKLSSGWIVSRPEITYIGNERDYIIHQVEFASASPQYAVGLTGQKRFGWLYAEGNALYSSYSMTFDVTTYANQSRPLRQMTETFGYIDLQVMGGLISQGFRIGVGPVMHLLANHESELVSLENYVQKLRTVSYGFSGCVGYDFGRFAVDLKYDKAFRTIGDHIYYRFKKSRFLETPDGLNLSFTYKFYKKEGTLY